MNDLLARRARPLPRRAPGPWGRGRRAQGLAGVAASATPTRASGAPSPPPRAPEPCPHPGVALRVGVLWPGVLSHSQHFTGQLADVDCITLEMLVGP